MSTKVTISEVANLAGVSIKTVSRVINKEPTVRASTIEKVQEAIASLNYTPNLAARNLAGTTSYSVGFIYDNPNAYYIIDMQKGILDQCHQHGYDLIIHPCNSRSDTVIEEISNMVRTSRMAGLVLTPPFSESAVILSALSQLNIHIVRIISGSDHLFPEMGCINIDDKKAAETITTHLIALNHEEIAFIAGDAIHKSTTERLSGFLATLDQHQLTPNNVIHASYAFDAGVEACKTLLAQPQKPSAIFACNDEIAAGVLFAARLMGVDVPEQLSIVGFENSPFSRQTWPKLTTAEQNTCEVAASATMMLINRIRQSQHAKPNNKDNNHTFTPEVIVRDSTQLIKQTETIS